VKLELIPTIPGLRQALAPHRKAQRSIGLVPTMGALHPGHGSLIDSARRECDVVVVTIFVNPIQFNQAADYTRYPRTLETDLSFCDERNVDYVFAPSEKEIYPAPLDTHVEVDRLTDHLCGAHRPGHFRGVATIVAKLFLIALPDKAYFGEKDAQQLAVIARMTRDLNIPVEVVPVPIVREADGLALSSRNQHLSAAERRTAPVLYQGLQAALQAIEAGVRVPGEALRAATEIYARKPELRVEYLEVVDAAEMQPVGRIEGPVRIAVAAWLGETRLIDNVGWNRDGDGR
jgi:pantoate--beta-alanine ligase